MSKRDMRAKKLLLAVLLAMSVQSYYAAPAWAAEDGQLAGQTDTVDGKGQSDGTTTLAGDEAETVRKTDTKQEADEALTIMGYSVNTLNADDEYGVMPTIVAPGGNPNAYWAGTNAGGESSDEAVGIGYNAKATSAPYSVLLGAYSETTAKYAVALGYSAKGSHENSVAIGANSTTTAVDQVSFGKWDSTTSTWTTTRSLAGIKDIEMAGALYINGIGFKVDRSNGNVSITGENTNSTKSVAVGVASEAWDEGSTALGYGAAAFNPNSVAIGRGAKAYNTAENSVAIGANSIVENEYEVSFGDADTDLYRDLINVKGIKMTGAITGLTSINGVDINDILDGGSVDLTNITTNLAVKASEAAGAATTFSIDHATGNVITAGSITAASGTIGGITLNRGYLNGVTHINGAVLDMENDNMVFGWEASASGSGLIAFGKEAIASGSGSVAIGDSAVAGDTGKDRATAIGSWSGAYSAYSTAIGAFSNVDAERSMALGYMASVYQAVNSVAIGTGSNTFADNEVNFGYYTLNDDGNVDINGTYYGRSLAGISSIDFIAGEYGDTGAITGLTKVNDVHFVIDKDNENVAISDEEPWGTSSVIIGIGAVATTNGTAIGNQAEAFNVDSTAVGMMAKASGEASIAVGVLAEAVGDNALAIGGGANAGHSESVAIGYDSTTSAANQVAFGKMTDPATFRSLAGIKDITLTGAVNGVTLGVKGGTADDKDNVLVGGVDVTELGTNIGGIKRTGAGTDVSPYVTDIEGIKFSSDALDLGGVWTESLETNPDAPGFNMTKYTSNGKGALNGITSINGMNFLYNGYNSNIILGANVDTVGANTIAIGMDAVASGYEATLVGNNATASGAFSTALGNYASATKMEATAIGIFAEVAGEESVGVGSNSTNRADQTIVIGVSANVSNADYKRSTVIGAYATSSAKYGIALGAKAEVKHENSVAIGTESTTTAANQVSFGGADESSYRSLAGIKDIEMTGAVNGVTLGVKGGTADDKDNVLVGGVDVTQLQTDVAGKADKATTLSGYGITDAYTKEEANVKLAEKVDVSAYNTKMSALESADTDLSSRATALETAVNDTTTGLSATYTKAEANAVSIGELQTATTGMSYSGAAGAEMTTFAGGVAAANLQVGSNFGVTADGALTAATINGVTITGTDADKNATIGGYSLKDISDDIAGLQTSSGGNAGDISDLQTKTTNISYDKDKAETTVDGVVIKAGKLEEVVSINGISFADGKVGGVTIGAAGISGTDTFNGVLLQKDGSNYTVGDVDVTELKTTISDSTNGLLKRTDDLETAVNDTTTGLATTNKIATDNASAIGELQTATTGMTYSGTAGAEMTTFAGGVAATVVTAGEFKLTGTAFGLSSDGALTAASFNGVTIDKSGTSGDVIVGGINLSQLKNDGGTTSANTAGVEHNGGTGADSYTTIEGSTKINSEGIAVTGKVTATEFIENGKTLAEIYAGKEAFEDVSTLVGDENGGLVKATADLQTVTTGMSYDAASQSTTFSGNLVVGVAGSGTHTQITESAIIFGEGGNMQVTVDASGIHVGNGISTFAAAAGGTHLDHEGLKTGTVTATQLSVNGAAISGNAADGLSIGGVNVNDLDSDVTDLKKAVENIQNNGTSTADMAGVTRTDEDGDGLNDTTTIESATSFTKAGMKTSNLEAATATIGGVQFAASGVVTGVSSINGVTFSSDGKINGAVITSTSFNGVDIQELADKVDGLGSGGGSTGGSTGGSGGSSDGSGFYGDELIIAKGDKDQTTINKEGITVGKNNSHSIINGNGLYIGVGSSGDLDAAKFSINSSSGKLTSNAGGHSFINSSNGAEFSNSGGKTTITGGKIETNELWVGGNKVNVSGGTVDKNDAINNQLSNNKDGYDYTNGFTTSEVGGTTQSATKESDANNDKKEKWETTNNTSAGGTSITTTKTSTNSAGKTTVQSSSVNTNEHGMTVSKTTTTTNKEGEEEKKTSSTEISGGEVTLHREDGSRIEVGSAIEGLQSDVQALDGKVNRMGAEIKEVGALSAALAGLHPQPENANSRADFAMAMGSYEGKQALAVGGFYRPDKRTMLSIGASTTSSKHMMNMGISIALDRMPEAERKEQESNVDLSARMKKLEADYEARLAKMEVAYEARMERLEARYARMQEAYEAERELENQEQAAGEAAVAAVKEEAADQEAVVA
jgi:hypothetical protein